MVVPVGAGVSPASMPLDFHILSREPGCAARLGRVTTPHGSFDTPAFMPVGTRGTVKGLLPGMVAATGAQIILGNTYHLLLRPGPATVEKLGGLHAFTNWSGPMLTDSGGYQAYSLAAMNRVDDEGVVFKSIIDGSEVALTPERATLVQNQLGADIIMAFDDCPPSVDPAAGPVSQDRLKLAVERDRAAASSRARTRLAYDHGARLRTANERTVRWLERCKAEHHRIGGDRQRALFGIIQGGTDPEQRRWSAERICGIDLPGYAIGGVAVGESTGDIANIVRFTAPLIPENKPRYLMGVGYERDLLAAVRAGMDMFDCVLPTRNGRNASAFTPTGQIRLRNAKYAEDDRPIEPGCPCPACSPGVSRGLGWAALGDKPFSRAYIRHLFFAKEMLGPILVSLHNLQYFQRFMADIRAAIVTGGWEGLGARYPVATPAGDIRGTGDG